MLLKILLCLTIQTIFKAKAFYFIELNKVQMQQFEQKFPHSDIKYVSFIQHYEIYCYNKQNNQCEYIMKNLPKQYNKEININNLSKQQFQELQNILPKYIKISIQNNQELIFFQKVSNQYFIILNYTNNYIKQLQKRSNYTLYNININNYIYSQQNKNKIQFSNPLKQLIIEEFRVDLNTQISKFSILNNGSTCRMTYIEQINCNNEGVLKCLNLSIIDRGYNSNSQNIWISYIISMKEFDIKKNQILKTQISSNKDGLVGNYITYFGSKQQIYITESAAQEIHYVHNISNYSVNQLYPLSNNRLALINNNQNLIIFKHYNFSKFPKEPTQFHQNGYNITYQNESCGIWFQFQLLVYKQISQNYIQICQQGLICLLISSSCEIISNKSFQENISNITWNAQQYMNDSNSLKMILKNQVTKRIYKQMFIPKNPIFNVTKIQFSQYYYNKQIYENFTSYREYYVDMLIRSKLYHILQQQSQEPFSYEKLNNQYSNFINNCQVIYEKQITKGKINPINLNFKNYNWTICALSFQTFDTLKLDITNNKQNQISKPKPYIILYCHYSLQEEKQTKQKCKISFKDYKGENKGFKSYIYSNSFYRLYIIRTAQRYNITVTNMDKRQFEEYVNILVIMISFIFGFILCIVCFGILRSIIPNLMVYYGWVEHEPTYNYPLNYFELKLKLKRLEDSGYLRKMKQSIIMQEPVQCCFCIQNLQINENTITLYCHHKFHSNCFTQWLKVEPNVKCPFCKRQFTRNSLNQFKQLQQINKSNLYSSQMSIELMQK